MGHAFNTNDAKLKLPRFNSSDKFDGPNPIDRHGNFLGQTTRFTFGVSRNSMKKVYVDEILKSGKELNEPGPSNYTMSPGFGQK